MLRFKVCEFVGTTRDDDVSKASDVRRRQNDDDSERRRSLQKSDADDDFDDNSKNVLRVAELALSPAQSPIPVSD